MIENQLALRQVKRIVTHANCGDGMASAMILRDAFNYFPPVEFVHYDTPEHRNMEVTEGVIFCDFSPHPDLAAQFLEAGAIVLDHHKTAKPIVSQFVKAGQGVFGDEELEPGVCGATLAYQHVWRAHPTGEQHPNVALRVEEFAIVAGVYDTWQTDSEYWNDAVAQQEALKFWDTGALLDARPSTWAKFLGVGATLVSRKSYAVDKAINASIRQNANGVRVCMFQGVTETSMAAEWLGDKVDLVVGFDYTADDGLPKIIYSLRSHTGFDCGAFCKGHGGGHTAAAEFKQQARVDPYSQFFGILFDWQQRQ